MIKAAIIIERADITLGGAERSVFELAAALRQLDVNITILAAKGQTTAKKVLALCENSKSNRTGFAAFKTRLKKHLADNHYDIIHSTLPFGFADIYQPRGGSYHQAIVRNAASYGNRFISSYKLLTSYANVRRSVLAHAESQLCKQDNHTILAALSKYVKEQFRQYLGLCDERIAVIPNGVKTDKIIDSEAAAQLRAQILSELGVAETDNPAIFLFVANNFRLKGLLSLIKALKVLSSRKMQRPVYITVAGSGSSKKYRRLAQKLGVSEKIAFLGPLRHIQNALSISDAAVLPTYYDPCSRFILEALSCKKPVITTEFNGAAEQFENNRHGRIIKSPEDIDALADTIAFYADTANVANASAAIAKDNLAEKISIERHAGQLVQLYNSIMKKREQK